jgi:hypothetical protein
MQTLTRPFEVKPNTFSVSAANAATYLPEGATLELMLSAAALEDGVAVLGQAVTWTAGSGFHLGETQSLTDASGMTSVQASLGPLAGGVRATATACARSGVCAAFDGIAVSQGDLRLALVSGGQQVVGGGVSAVPVVATVVDGAGHVVAGAAVHVYQTVSALNVTCPERGRCPGVPVLSSLVSVVTSDRAGVVFIAPLMATAGTGRLASTQTQMALTVGTQGFATAVVTVQP